MLNPPVHTPIEAPAFVGATGGRFESLIIVDVDASKIKIGDVRLIFIFQH